MSTSEGKSRPWWRRFLGSFWGQLLLAFIVTGLVVSFVAKPYVVPSGSMLETLQPGDRLIVDRLAYHFSEPATGDVVVFDADTAWEPAGTTSVPPLKAAWLWLGQWTGFGPSGPHTLVKRVIGGGGQTVSCCSADGRIIVNGEPISEAYLFNDFAFTPGVLDCTTTPRSARCFDQVTVPEGHYLVLGDNRSNSSDSALNCRIADADPATCWRWASRTGVVGRAAATFWPVNRWRSLQR